MPLVHLKLIHFLVMVNVSWVNFRLTKKINVSWVSLISKIINIQNCIPFCSLDWHSLLAILHGLFLIGKAPMLDSQGLRI